MTEKTDPQAELISRIGLICGHLNLDELIELTVRAHLGDDPGGLPYYRQVSELFAQDDPEGSQLADRSVRALTIFAMSQVMSFQPEKIVDLVYGICLALPFDELVEFIPNALANADPAQIPGYSKVYSLFIREEGRQLPQFVKDALGQVVQRRAVVEGRDNAEGEQIPGYLLRLTQLTRAVYDRDKERRKAKSPPPGGLGSDVRSIYDEKILQAELEKSRKNRRRPPKPLSERRSADIIKCLEKVCAITGRRPSEVYADWLSITKSCLEALPSHVESAGRTGLLAEDTPLTAELFARMRSRYGGDYRSNTSHKRIWDSLCEAFAILLDITSPGLWVMAHSNAYDVGAGPDILGGIFEQWCMTWKDRHGQFMTPWSIARFMAMVTIGDGAAEVHKRLKEACLHPDNILAHAALMASLGLPEEAKRDWFFDYIIPAAYPYYKPITFLEPTIGSGRLMLAAAAHYPQWAVHYNLVQFFGMDIDAVLCDTAIVNSQIYGLNGYGLKLEVAALTALDAYRKRQALALKRILTDEVVLPPNGSIHVNGREYAYKTPPPGGFNPAATFEELFKEAANSNGSYVAAAGVANRVLAPA